MESKGSPHIVTKVKESAGKGWSSLKDIAKAGKERGLSKIRKLAGKEKQPDISKELAGVDILQVLQEGITRAKEIRTNSPISLPIDGDAKEALAQDQATKAADIKILDKRLSEFKKLPDYFASLQRPGDNALWSNNRLSIIAPERKGSDHTLESLDQGYDYPSKELIQIVLKSLGAISPSENIDHILEVAKKAAEKQPLTKEEQALIVSSHVDVYGHRQINLPSSIPGSTLNLDISPVSSAWGQDKGRDAYVIELFMNKQAQKHLITTSSSPLELPQKKHQENLLEAI